jgi:hypothetical protein
MSKLRIPPREEILLTKAEIASGLYDGLGEAVDFDTVRPGAYKQVEKGELIPIAILDGGFYRDHNLVSPEEAQRAYERDPSITVLPIKDWYETVDL